MKATAGLQEGEYLNTDIISCAFSVILGTGYPKLEIFGYPGTRK